MDRPTWGEAARAALRPATEAEIIAARTAARQALAAVRTRLADLPVGEALARELALDRLHELIEAASPDGAALREAGVKLRGYRPGAIHEDVIRLRTAVAHLASEAAATPEAIAAASAGIVLFDRPDEELQTLPPTDVRRAFAALAQLPRFDEALESLRRRASHPNVRLTARADYLLALARREFSVPVSYRTNLKNTELSVTGSVRLKTLLELPANDQRAELRIAVAGEGSLDLAGNRGAISVCATARPCAHAAHGFAFGPQGVEVGRLDLDVSNRTTLTGVAVDTPIGGRLVSAVLRRALTRRLPDVDRKASDTIEDQAKAKIADECADIAFRLNGLFDEQIVARLAGRDIEARPRYASSAGGIEFEASYARPEQLAALGPPPQTIEEQLGERDYTMWLHESAINNLTDGLANARLDESLYWMLLGEELKLEGSAAIVAGRAPATLTLAANDPLRIEFDDGAVSVSMNLAAFAADGVEQEVPAAVRATYRIASGPEGLRLQRQGAIDATNAPRELSAVLDQFFPEELKPKRRFRNNSFAQWLAIDRAVLEDGWLAIAINRHSTTRSAQAPEAKP